MQAILAIFIWLFIAIMSLAEFLATSCVAIFLFPFDRKRKIAHAQGFWWADAILGINPFWSLKLSGLENIDPKKTYVIVANHQSFFDIPLLYKTRLQFKWVAKESLFNIPLFGWSMSLGKHVKLARGARGSIKKAYDQAAGWLRQGVSVLFFPEGTRSASAEMDTFKNGAFKLAIQEKIPVLPIAINGTRQIIPRGGWIFQTKAYCTLRVFPAIETKDYLPEDFSHLRDTVRDKLNENLIAKSAF